MGKFFSRVKPDPPDPSVSTLGNLANFYSLLIFLIDAWGIDSESISVSAQNDLWIGDEDSPSIWRVNRVTGEVITRYSPFGASAGETAIDPVLAKRRPNGGFEGIACAPNRKVYAILQTPLQNPDRAAGEASRLHRIVEIDPGKRIVGIKNVTYNEPFFPGHFPGRPVMPGPLIVEGMAQTAGVLVFKSLPEEKYGRPVYFLGNDL